MPRKPKSPDQTPKASAQVAGDKQVDPKTIEKSVIATPESSGQTPSPSLDSSLLWMVAQAGDEISPWGLRPKVRDRQLREFYPTESLFSSALGVVTSRNAGFKWTVEGSPRVAARVHQILEDADSGRGWVSFISKLSVDLYTQDYGAFIEIVREGNSPEGALLGINPLDAARCWHTGNPEKPVIYEDIKGKFHELDYWSVVPLVELPTPRERSYGLQVCALSRLLLAAQITKNIAIYTKEKTGGRNAQSIHLIAGITNQQIQDAISQVKGEADAKGLMRFLGPLLVGSVDPKANIDVKTVELTSLPDNFNAETVFKHYVSQIAMAFLADYQDFAPLPGGNLGTSAQSEMLHQKARGKGSAVFRKLIVQAMNYRILPCVTEFQFEEQDPDADEQQARIKLIRAQERAARLLSKELTTDEARQLAMDDGDLPEELFEAGGAEDATDEHKLPSGEKPEVPDASEHIEEEGEQPEEGAKGEPEVSSDPVPFSFVKAASGSKERAGPFEDERIKAERKLRLAVEKAFRNIFTNIKKRLRREGRKEIAFKGRSDVPNDEAFWSLQKAEFMAAVGDQPQELLQQGVQQASDLGLAVGFDVVNQQVLDLSATYTDQWWEQLSGTTRRGMRTAVQTHIEEGTPLKTLEKDLEPLFGKKRAKLIAATEVTRLYTEGNRVAFEDSSVDQTQWMTVKDAVVDPDCVALQGQRWPLGQNPVSPPLHPNCRCWLAPVVCGGEKGAKQESCTVLTKRVDKAPEAPEVPDYIRAVNRAAPKGLNREAQLRARDRLDARFRDKSPEYRALADAAESWTGSSVNVRRASRAWLQGKPVPKGIVGDRMRALTDAVRSSGRHSKTLYRGMSMPGDPEDIAAFYRANQRVSIPLSSASRAKSVAKEFASHAQDPSTSTSAMLEFQDAQGISAGPFSDMPESEVIVGGTFEVVSVDVRGRTLKIVLRQVGAFPNR